jgi:hypothetical protein
MKRIEGCVLCDVKDIRLWNTCARGHGQCDNQLCPPCASGKWIQLIERGWYVCLHCGNMVCSNHYGRISQYGYASCIHCWDTSHFTRIITHLYPGYKRLICLLLWMKTSTNSVWNRLPRSCIFLIFDKVLQIQLSDNLQHYEKLKKTAAPYKF